MKREHKAAKKCHIGFKEFNDPENRNVRDHCHYTDLYQGAAQNQCNLKYRIPDNSHVLFHNLSGYDAYPVYQELQIKFKKSNIIIIISL